MKGKLTNWMMFLSFSICFATAACSNNSSKNNLNDSAKNKKDSLIGKIPPAIIPIKEDSSKQYVFLTFDDGPQPPGTSNVMHICKDLGVKASFFMVGAHVTDEYRRSLVDSVRNAYPEFLLCNHSITHAFSDKYKTFYNEPDSALKDFFKAQQTLNVPYKIVRLPGNSAWVRQGEVFSTKQTRPVCKLLDSAGYNVIGWDVEWQYQKTKAEKPLQSADAMIKMVEYALDNHTSHSPNNVVILEHDRMFKEPDSQDTLRKFITALKNNPHYVLETIDKYPRLKIQ
ncbi:MAG: polysaccharide deacetylase family protein [Chitinophagaceae bacterium]